MAPVQPKQAPGLLDLRRGKSPLTGFAVQGRRDLDRRQTTDQQRMAIRAMAQVPDAIRTGLGSVVATDERGGVEIDRRHLAAVLQHRF